MSTFDPQKALDAADKQRSIVRVKCVVTPLCSCGWIGTSVRKLKHSPPSAKRKLAYKAAQTHRSAKACGGTPSIRTRWSVVCKACQGYRFKTYDSLMPAWNDWLAHKATREHKAEAQLRPHELWGGKFAPARYKKPEHA